MNNKIIAPSILDIDPKDREKTINEYLDMGIKWVHYDFMDNIFVPNLAISIDEFKNLINSTKKHVSDAHLMVKDPENWAEKIKKYVTCLTIHFESLSEEKIVNFAKRFSVDNWVGLAIKPKTNFEEFKEIIHYFDIILIMSVEPGFGGQKFIKETIQKIKKISNYIKEKKISTLIQVDGGLNDENSKIVFEAGANILVCGSYLYKNKSKNTIEKLLK